MVSAGENCIGFSALTVYIMRARENIKDVEDIRDLNEQIKIFCSGQARRYCDVKDN